MNDDRTVEKQLWADHFAGPTDDTRNKLIEYYYDYMKMNACRIANSMAVVEADDLIQYGVFGLIRAINKYDPRKGTFRRFATKHIRGSIMDCVRDTDWVPRLARRREKAYHMAAGQCRQELLTKFAPAFATILMTATPGVL